MRHISKLNNFICIILAAATITACGKSDATEAQAAAEQSLQEQAVLAEVYDQMEIEDAQPELTPEPTPEPTPQTVNIRMVGDILLHDRVEASARNEDGEYDFSVIFENVKEDIEAADIAIVNQEVIIGGEELGVSGYPAFNAPTEIGDALTETGFDVIAHATNHAMDKGRKGILNTLEYWDTNSGAVPIGIYDTEEESHNIYVAEVNGIKIAILNYTYGTNGICLPSDMPYAVNLLKEDKVREDIRKAHEEADFVIVCPHWGTEYRLTPDSMQEKWTKIFLEENVDLVIGTHPHVIENIEMLEDEDSEMLVYYSLGNFVNWTSGEGEGVYRRMVGGMADVTIGLDENGEAIITDYGVEALVTDLTEGYNGVSTYRLSDYTKEQAELNLIRKQDSNFSYDSIHELCDQVWGDLWY